MQAGGVRTLGSQRSVADWTGPCLIEAQGCLSSDRNQRYLLCTRECVWAGMRLVIGVSRRWGAEETVCPKRIEQDKGEQRSMEKRILSKSAKGTIGFHINSCYVRNKT